MQLTLVVPGLIWPPGPEGHPAREWKPTGLARVLSRAHLRWHAGADLHQWLAAAHGFEGREPPWGALRAAGQGIDPGEATWMCADPIHLRVLRDRCAVADDRELAITAEEANALVEALDREFGPAVRFVAADPARWYVRVSEPPDLHTHPLARAVGRRPDALLPRGPDAPAWLRRLNDIQVLLHHHPVNVAREAAGRPTINSVWLWGAGRWPRGMRERSAVIATDDPLVRGLAAACGARALALPPGAAALDAEREAEVSVVLDALQDASLYRDPAQWCERLAAIERDWIAPLERAVRSRRNPRISSLRLIAPGDAALLELDYGIAQSWRFWRRPIALGELVPPENAA